VVLLYFSICIYIWLFVISCRLSLITSLLCCVLLNAYVALLHNGIYRVHQFYSFLLHLAAIFSQCNTPDAIYELTVTTVILMYIFCAMWVNYFAPRRGAEYCNHHVCVSVRSRVSKTARPNCAKFSVHVNRDPDSVLLWWPCDALCTSGFADNVKCGSWSLRRNKFVRSDSLLNCAPARERNLLLSITVFC